MRFSSDWSKIPDPLKNPVPGDPQTIASEIRTLIGNSLHDSQLPEKIRENLKQADQLLKNLISNLIIEG